MWWNRLNHLTARGALVGAVAIAGLAGCSKSQAATASPFDGPAAGVVDDLAAGRFGAVRTHFDPLVASHLAEPDLQTAWRSFEERLGRFRSAAKPKNARRGELTVEQVPVTMANGKGEVRVTYHPDGTIAGLYFLKSGVPVP